MQHATNDTMAGPAAAAATGKTAASEILPRALPFIVFISFIAAEEAARALASAGVVVLPPGGVYYLYPVKAVAAALLLYLYRERYRELSFASLGGTGRVLASAAAGVVTFALWVRMPWTLPVMGVPQGFDPGLLPAGPVRVGMLFFRVAGAALVVPLMEELFWRSFLLRYLVDADFESVELGRFTVSSFIISVVLFGLEHHFFFAGIMAGVIYTLVLYRTRSIGHCVLAHAVTNLALAIYVLCTGKWYFW